MCRLRIKICSSSYPSGIELSLLKFCPAFIEANALEACLRFCCNVVDHSVGTPSSPTILIHVGKRRILERWQCKRSKNSWPLHVISSPRALGQDTTLRHTMCVAGTKA